MNIKTISQTRATTFSYDEGLRTYMTNIYKYMGIALAITGAISYIVANVPGLLKVFFGTPLSILVMFAPLIFVFYFNSKIWKVSPEQAKNYLWIYSGLMGLSLSYIFIIYTGASVVRTFFVSASMFGAMSLYGYTTKKDLTGMGSFMMMGLIGLIIASLVNIFLKSPGMEFAISLLGVVIFTALTAYDVQKIKNTYDNVGTNSDIKEKVAVIGALNLYMDFINLFLFLLRFMGSHRE